MNLLAIVDWEPVAIALAASIPAVAAALISWLNRNALRTSNGTTVGAQIEQTHALVREAKEQTEHVAEALDKANGV